MEVGVKRVFSIDDSSCAIKWTSHVASPIICLPTKAGKIKAKVFECIHDLVRLCPDIPVLHSKNPDQTLSHCQRGTVHIPQNDTQLLPVWYIYHLIWNHRKPHNCLYLINDAGGHLVSQHWDYLVLDCIRCVGSIPCGSAQMLSKDSVSSLNPKVEKSSMIIQASHISLNVKCLVST